MNPNTERVAIFTMNLDMTLLISALMETEDVESLRLEYGSEMVEEAIEVLNSRV